MLLPGFVDLHTHLREPGREDTETVATGSAAAALGGFTAVHAMANTTRSPTTPRSSSRSPGWAREAGLVDVRPVGAVSKGLRGEQLAEIGNMARSAAAVRVFSDDGQCVHDARLMRRALEYVKPFDAVDRAARAGPAAGRRSTRARTRASCPGGSGCPAGRRSPRSRSSPAT